MSPKRPFPRRVLLLDTFSLFFRAFYGLPLDLSMADGTPTNALYGFSQLALKLLREQRPLGLCWALDTGKQTHRKAQYPEYKAHRDRAPSPLVQQLKRLDELLDAFGGVALGSPGFEGDDVLATVATELEAEGTPSLVVSGDRDTLQLASELVSVLFVGVRGKDHVLYDVAAVEKRFSVTPGQLPSYVALVGDSSDNLPGVPGVGPKTASKLIAAHGDIDGLYTNIDAVKPAKARAAIAEREDQVRLNEQLARLQRDVPLPAGPHHRAPGTIERDKLTKLFEALEFQTLIPRIDKAIPRS